MPNNKDEKVYLYINLFMSLGEREEYKTADLLLVQLDPKRLGEECAIAILTGTLQYKRKLGIREAFYYETETFLKLFKDYDDDQIQQILQGLK